MEAVNNEEYEVGNWIATTFVTNLGFFGARVKDTDEMETGVQALLTQTSTFKLPNFVHVSFH